jgi:hypothetical protein
MRRLLLLLLILGAPASAQDWLRYYPPTNVLVGDVSVSGDFTVSGGDIDCGTASVLCTFDALSTTGPVDFNSATAATGGVDVGYNLDVAGALGAADFLIRLRKGGTTDAFTVNGLGEISRPLHPLIYVTTADATPVGTSEETVAVYPIPAGTLDTNGKGFCVTASSLKDADANSVVMRIRFGPTGNVIGQAPVASSTALIAHTSSTASASFVQRACVIRTGAATQDFWGTSQVGSASTALTGPAAQTLADQLDVFATLTNGTAANDASLLTFSVTPYP